MSQNPTGVNKTFDWMRAAGRSLWLAGVGAVAEVSEESGEVFDRLVERGKPLAERQKKMVEAVTERATRTAREAGKLVQDTVEYESRGVLKRLNVLTRDDVKVLNARIGTLSQKIDEVVARRQAAAAPAKTIEIVSPQGEPAAVVIPVTSTSTTATARPQASRPRQKKATR
jgi:poly(hydroxyalkanoate) granule-associated protein